MSMSFPGESPQLQSTRDASSTEIGLRRAMESVAEARRISGGEGLVLRTTSSRAQD